RPGAWDGSIGLAGLLRGLLANLRGERRAAAPGAQLVDGIVDVLPGAVILVLGERLLKAHVAGTPGRGRLAAIVARDAPHESAPVLVLGKRRLQPGACLLQRSQLIRCGPGCHRPPPAILGRACEAAKAQNAQSLQRTSVARNQPFLRSLRRPRSSYRVRGFMAPGAAAPTPQVAPLASPLVPALETGRNATRPAGARDETA